MSATKLIVVVGATGNQGGSVVNTFRQLPQWGVRAVTRNPASEKALALKACGVDVIQADLGDETSLQQAFEGADAIFVNTDFFSTLFPKFMGGMPFEEARRLSYDNELQHVKNAANAAAAIPTLRRFVYSAFAPMKEGSGGKYDDDLHWESRADGVAYLEKELPQLAQKTSYIHCGAYMNNPFLVAQADSESGGFHFIRNSSPEARWPILDPVASVGPFVRALIEDEEPRTKLLAYNSYLTLGETHQLWQEVTGEKVEYKHVSLEEMQAYCKLPREILDGPACIDEFGYMPGIEKYIEPHQLQNPVKLAGFEEYLRNQSRETLLTSKFWKMS